MELQFIERLAVRFLFKAKMAELHTAAFETFFQDLMCLRYPDFVDVRTAGSLGDFGSDGLLLHSGKLYACYGPEVFDPKKVEDKFQSDLDKAKVKRTGQFGSFVFVHNDIRGLHPAVSALLPAVVEGNPNLTFEIFGYRRFRDEVMKLDRRQVEDLLGMPLPVSEITYGVALEELEPLLVHLRERRVRNADQEEIKAVSIDKLNFNKFTEDTKDELRRMMVRSVDIEHYYTSRIDITERDEVANAFREEYLHIRKETFDPDEILWHLEQYILGNASAPLPQRRGALAILAYFFQSCDILENPPPGWIDPSQKRGSA